MHNGTAVTYVYDGSFDGMLTCVFEAFYSKDIIDNICDESSEFQQSFFGAKYIETDEEKARRVYTSVKDKISKRAQELVILGHLTCEARKEMMVLEFLRAGYRFGPKITSMLTLPEVLNINKATDYLKKESHKYKGFIRFSDIGGVLYAQIEPVNHVLPLLAPHFTSRYSGESFVIFDKNRQMALIYSKRQSVIAPVEEWQIPEPQEEEIFYEKLWKRFYENVAIKERTNHKCRRNFMPKRYWNQMTEFTFREDLHGQKLLEEQK